MEVTREYLEAVNKPKLYELAQYYNLDVNYKSLKDDIINVLLEHYNKVEQEEVKSQEAELPQMSARVRRIYEQNKEK